MGTNTMTGEQKSLLIYGAPPAAAAAVPLHVDGHSRMRPRLVSISLCRCDRTRAGSLAAFFALFISGYLLD
jgi:hypothetical protein